MGNHLRTVIVGVVCMLASSSVFAPAAASARSYSGTVTGVFDTPALTGAYFDAESREPVACDNTSSDGGFGAATSNFTWGDGHGASAVEFVGNDFDEVAPDEVFPLGTVTFFNGWNTPASLVFGLRIQLSAGDGVTPFTSPVGMTSTLNHNRDRVADADVLTFDASEVSSGLAGFENAAVKAIVYGKITDGSVLEVTSISLAPGEEEHGCVADGPSVDTLPCASSCGSVCAAGALALSGPICGDEALPASVRGRIDQALRLLGRAEGKDSAQKAKKGVRLALKRLQKSAAIAGNAAKEGRLSADCADALARAVRNAKSQAEPWLNG